MTSLKLLRFVRKPYREGEEERGRSKANKITKVCEKFVNVSLIKYTK